MKFTFTEKKMDSSEELRAYSEKKIGKLDRFFRSEAEAFVTYSIERGRFRAEITIKNGGLFLEASSALHTYSPSIPIISIMMPNEKSTTHIRDAQPRIGVPMVNFSTITSIISNAERMKNVTPTPDMNLMGT